MDEALIYKEMYKKVQSMKKIKRQETHVDQNRRSQWLQPITVEY